MNSHSFTKSYGTQVALTMPDLEWVPGCIYAVIGANGSGKSTLAKVISGAESADGNQKPFIGLSVGYLPQKPYAFRMRLEKNLYLNGSDHARAARLMNQLGLASLRRKPAHRLSGGETAKLALARLLMRDYDLLILDEPTAAMDMESTLAAEKLIQSYRDQTGCAVILITHSLRQAQRISNRIIYLEQGELMESGDSERLLQSPQKSETKRFLQFFGFENLS